MFAVPVLVVVIPEALRRRLSWDGAPERARELLSAWLAVGAATVTWLYIFLLRFGGQALSGKQPFNTLALAALAIGVAAFLTPFYRFVARSCWKYGIGIVFDPGPQGAWRQTWTEVKCATTVRSDQTGQARVWHHENCRISHRSRETADRCRNR